MRINKSENVIRVVCRFCLCFLRRVGRVIFALLHFSKKIFSRQTSDFFRFLLNPPVPGESCEVPDCNVFLDFVIVGGDRFSRALPRQVCGGGGNGHRSRSNGPSTRFNSDNNFVSDTEKNLTSVHERARFYCERYVYMW